MHGARLVGMINFSDDIGIDYIIDDYHDRLAEAKKSKEQAPTETSNARDKKDDNFTKVPGTGMPVSSAGETEL